MNQIPNNQNQDKNNAKNSSARANIGEGTLKFASVLVGIAVIIFCYAYTKIQDGGAQLLACLAASFILSFGILLIVAVIFARKAQKNPRNFFLYDKKLKREIPVSSLTFEEMRLRTLKFMSIFKYRGKLYIGDLFGESANIPEHFKPLFCYELLYELAIDDGMDAKAFLSFGNECAEIFSKYLRSNGDYELASRVCSFIYDFPRDKAKLEEFKTYIKEKEDHIKEKMLSYTVKNIEKFK